MGSSTTRKGNDQRRINLPLNSTGNGSGIPGGGAGAGSPPIDINNICKPVFRQRLTREDLAPHTPLIINDGSIYPSLIRLLKLVD